jgi:hypothetical protein
MPRVRGCEEVGCPGEKGRSCVPILWPCLDEIIGRGYEIDHATTRLRCIECREIGGRKHKKSCSLHPDKYAIEVGAARVQFYPVFGGLMSSPVCHFINLRCQLASGEMLNCAPGDQCRNYLRKAGYVHSNGLWICKTTLRQFGWRDSPLYSIRKWEIR